MSSTFADLGVSRPVADALNSRGIKSPFPVQKLVIADVLAGHDVLVQSPTGSGKTLAFGVPLVDRISAEAARPAALILAPTRELARQIEDEIYSIAHSRALKITVVYGGVGIQPQIRAAKKAHILVATPGRLEDLLERRAVNLSGVRHLVLDEADRMLDMGFKPAVDRIVKLTPSNRQTLFFSATLEGATGKLAAEFTNNARRHVQAPVRAEREAIEHRFVQLPSQSAKVDALIAELRADDSGRTLVFVRTKRGADRLVQRLATRNVKAVAMHGNKSQSQRQNALARFERGDVETLIATDVAARGIDVADITHVINFDAPDDQDAYTHRVGRTGRAGQTGSGVSFVLADQAHEMRRMAAGIGLATEFDRREGAEHGSTPAKKSGSQSHNRNGRPQGGPGGGKGRRDRQQGGQGHGRGGSGGSPRNGSGRKPQSHGRSGGNSRAS